MATYTLVTPTLEQGHIGGHRLFTHFKQRTKSYTIILDAGVYYLTQYPTEDELATYTAYYMGGCQHTGITEAIRTAMIADGIVTSANFTTEQGQMHQHISKVLEWGFSADHNFEVALWGCVLCDVTADKPFEYEEVSIDHTQCNEDCFGCKAKNLQLNAGDARGDVIASGTTQKKWNSELEAYRSARAQGIQPNGTKRKQIEAAHDASDRLGAAYDGGTMVQAQKIDKPTATVMRELKEAGIQ